MNLESLVKFFAPKSMSPGAVPCGIATGTLTITDVMASIGMATSRAAVGIELYFAKAGVLAPDNILAYLKELATNRACRHRALQKMTEADRDKFLHTLVYYVFRDYSLSAASRVICTNCCGEGFIDAEVFTMKAAMGQMTRSSEIQLMRFSKPMPGNDLKPKREVVRALCNPCEGKGSIKNECRCRGRGETLDKKKTELQGIPVYKECPRCKGRGYPRLKDTEIFKALGVTEMIWRRNFKLFFERLVEHCHIEESYAEGILKKITV
ncbi:antitermination protein [Buttiauxella sp. 3AFRM03]|uniref:antitermination protein Q n=1 Tax=Buttiauxella sp. 3AFRM03 TaxID=2479367 RepID=UPI000EF7E8AB|nr:antitermination protein [Buttiauxella sp. 3AFRM03]AYN30192.1 antitermination protein [Buttiauxella sp. 3AFRM03]